MTPITKCPSEPYQSAQLYGMLPLSKFLNTPVPHLLRHVKMSAVKRPVTSVRKANTKNLPNNTDEKENRGLDQRANSITLLDLTALRFFRFERVR